MAEASRPTLSASEFEFGGSVTIYTNRKTVDVKHILQYKIENSSYVNIASDITDSYTWKITMDLANKLPNAAKGAITFRLRTILLDGSMVGNDQYISAVIKVPDSVVPTVDSITCTDAHGLYSKYGAYVQGKSPLTITVKASGIYGSTIESYAIMANGVQYNSNIAATSALATAGQQVVFATVGDSRGRYTTDKVYITVLAYNNPIIAVLKAVRCLSDGTEDESGAYMKVTVETTISSLNSKNSKTFTLKYKKKTNSAWTTHTTYTSAYTWRTSVIIAADTNSQYDIQLTATDDFATSTATTAIGTAFTLVDYNASGEGIAFGKVSEKDAFECALPAIFKSCVTESGADLDSLLQDEEGMFILPNGLKICWGWTATTNLNGYFRSGTVTFPVTYTTQPTVLTTDWIYNQDSTDAGVTTSMRGCSNKQAVLVAKNPNGGLANRNVDISYIAIGY